MRLIAHNIYKSIRHKNYFNDFITIFFNKNIKFSSQLNKTIKEFKPDIIYVHNTWFKASLGTFKVLEKHNIPVFLKLHNFRYFCTKSYYLSEHLGERRICEACGIKKEDLKIFNKYYDNSYFKSFLITRYGKKYFKILENDSINIIVLTNFHKDFLKQVLYLLLYQIQKYF